MAEFNQLAGHKDKFKEVRLGFISKSMNKYERDCYKSLREDKLNQFVAEIGCNNYLNDSDEEVYVELKNLLHEFNNPSIIDVKIGTRTFYEDEETRKKDYYDKLFKIAPSILTTEEDKSKKVMKKRYLKYRDQDSSTRTLGFRIESICKGKQKSTEDFRKVKEKENVKAHLKAFADKTTMEKYLKRLNALKDALKESEFFKMHELVGSSLLFVHDSEKANIWMIDFGKTRPLPAKLRITHDNQYVDNNHEDGYLIGINNLIKIFQELISEQPSREQPSPEKPSRKQPSRDINNNHI